MFEFEGYPCRHMLCYMKIKQVMLLPEKYILRRWTKNAKQAIVFDATTGSYVDHGPGQSLMSRHGLLSHSASELVDDAALTDARSTFLLGEFQSLRIRVNEIDNGGDVRMNRNISMQSREETQVVCDPNPIRAKRCGKRHKGGKEKTLSQSNRQCGACHASGHDRRTCPMVQNRLDNTYQSEYSQGAPAPQYSNHGLGPQYPYHAPESQYSYHAPEDNYTISGTSNYEATPSFFNNQFHFL